MTQLDVSVLDRLRKQLGASDQLVLFGSRAAQVARPNSDWDVLLVRSDAPAIRCASRIDLVQVPRLRLSSSAWLGSELAGHIAEYGRWIVGEPTWIGAVHRSREAVERKGTRLARRLSNMEPSWQILQPGYKQKFTTIVRRDVQRFRCLVEGRAVAPSSILDDTWDVEERDVAFALLHPRLTPTTRKFLERLLTAA